MKTAVVTSFGSKRGTGRDLAVRFGRDIMAGRIDEGRLPYFISRPLLGRLGAVSKVSALIEFPIGTDAGYISGSTYNINSGARIG